MRWPRPSTPQFAHPGPALIDAVVDADEPMLPPKRRESYMKHLDEAFEKGTPGEENVRRRMEEEPARTMLQN